MKRIIIILTGLFFNISIANAGLAYATFASTHNFKIQVIVDNKVINSEPKSVVKIKSSVGLRQLTIKVYDSNECLIDVINESIFVKSGFESKYQIFTEDEVCIQLKNAGYTVIYHERLRRPDRFYNKRHLAHLGPTTLVTGYQLPDQPA